MRFGLFAFILFIFASFNLQAQIQLGYLNYSQKRQHLRTTDVDSAQLELPFWDDFSTSYLFPDTSLWVNSQNVNIQTGIGILPPSINVAVFDGADQYGNPYSSQPTAEGIGDSLVSRFINLSDAGQASTYLSFYYQKEGLGELPDENDFLRLLIKDTNNEWTEVWRISGSDLEENDEFFYESILIDLPEYFHEYFQFKFESFGRLSGDFDTWNVDYIYLNENRSGDRLDLSDHTILTHPTSIFKAYTSVPYDQFMSDPEMYLNTTSFDMMNIEAEETNIESTVIIKDRVQNSVIDTVEFERELDNNINPFEVVSFTSSIIQPDNFLDLEDSLYLSTFVYINTLDTIDIVNLRVNDTVTTEFSIHEDLAYDDGTAEFTSGLNSYGGQIAYRFYTPIEDQITGMKIYFPNVSTQSGGSTFEIKVWDELSNEGNNEIYSQSVTRQNAIGFNEFSTYYFNKKVTVQDTFYIGFQQLSEGFFVVGYDKNTSSGSEIFFNTGFVWEPNTDLQGSLMIRPIFGDPGEIITGLPEIHEKITVFPNPSEGIFKFSDPVRILSVYDSFGRKIRTTYNRADRIIDLTGQSKGIYFVLLYDGEREWTEKLILK